MGNKFDNECLDCLKSTLIKEIKKQVAPWALNFDPETIPLDKLPAMTDIIQIRNNNWYINGVDTGVRALGAEGKSAYQEAVSLGFQGTEVEWLLSLKGEKGDKGDRGIQGPQGIAGINGTNGTNGLKGDVPEIINGYWYVGGFNTGIKATGENGQDGRNGRDGANGTNGSDGASSFIRIAYANVTGSTISNFSTTDATDRTHLGICIKSNNDTPAPGEYSWALIKGRDGQNGATGEQGPQGNPSYIHIKYSNDNGLTFTANNGETEGIYMGQCVTDEAQDPDNPSRYRWARIRGIDGDNGMSINIKGNLADAAALLGLDPAELEIGDSYVLNSDGHLYTWTGLNWNDNGQFKGADGISEYIHIAWATSADGHDNFATSQEPGVEYTYMGVRKDQDSQDSPDYTKYMWSRIKGDQGEQGLDGRSAYDVYKDDVPSGTTPMSKSEWLQSLQGEVDPKTLQTIDDLDRQALRKGVTVGTLPVSGATTSNTQGFEVNEYGQLVASEAIIYGTIYANNGIFNGEIQANTGKVGGWTIGNGNLSSSIDLLQNSYISSVELNSSIPYIEVKKTYKSVGNGGAVKIDSEGLKVYQFRTGFGTESQINYLGIDGSGHLGEHSIEWSGGGHDLNIYSEYQGTQYNQVLILGDRGAHGEVQLYFSRENINSETTKESFIQLSTNNKLEIVSDTAIILNSSISEVRGALYFGDSVSSREYIDITSNYLTLHAYSGVMVEGDFIIDDFTHKYKLDVSAAVTAGILTQIA